MARIISRTRCVAVIDVGNGYVGCALVDLNKSKRSSVIAHGHSILSLEKRDYERARAQIPGEVAEALRVTLESASKKSRTAPLISDVWIVLHAPWTSSLSVSASEVFDKATLIRANHIAALAKKSLTSADLTSKAEFAEKKLYEKSVIATRLNGYKTFAPEGKRAQSLEVSAILSLGDPVLIKDLETAIGKALPARKISWVSANNVYATVFSHTEFSEDMLVVDVGISTTNITVLRGGVPVMDRVIAEGLQGILARVQSTEATQETLALFRMYARDACESTACVELRQAIAQAEPQLVKLFGEHLAELAAQRRLPNTVLVVAHPDVTQWLSVFFERIDFSQFTATAMPCTAHILTDADSARWVQGEDALDSALLLGAAYTSILEQST